MHREWQPIFKYCSTTINVVAIKTKFSWHTVENTLGAQLYGRNICQFLSHVQWVRFHGQAGFLNKCGRSSHLSRCNTFKASIYLLCHSGTYSFWRTGQEWAHAQWHLFFIQQPPRLARWQLSIQLQSQWHITSDPSCCLLGKNAYTRKVEGKSEKNCT